MTLTLHPYPQHVPPLRAIRNCPRIKRLVYVSCNPTKSMVRDAVLLCGPPSNKYFGDAFRPVRGIPVDMFPHTSHTEMIIVMERGVVDAPVAVPSSALAPDADAGGERVEGPDKVEVGVKGEDEQIVAKSEG